MRKSRFTQEQRSKRAEDDARRAIRLWRPPARVDDEYGAPLIPVCDFYDGQLLAWGLRRA